MPWNCRSEPELQHTENTPRMCRTACSTHTHTHKHYIFYFIGSGPAILPVIYRPSIFFGSRTESLGRMEKYICKCCWTHVKLPIRSGVCVCVWCACPSTTLPKWTAWIMATSLRTHAPHTHGAMVWDWMCVSGETAARMFVSRTNGTRPTSKRRPVNVENKMKVSNNLKPVAIDTHRLR